MWAWLVRLPRATANLALGTVWLVVIYAQWAKVRWLPYTVLFAVVTIPWAFTSPPATVEFYDVAATVMPVFLLVLLIELRLFAPRTIPQPDSDSILMRGVQRFFIGLWEEPFERSLRVGRPMLLTFYFLGECAAFFALAYGSSSPAFILTTGPLLVLLAHVFVVGARLRRPDELTAPQSPVDKTPR